MVTNRRTSMSIRLAFLALGLTLILPSMAHALPSSVKAPRVTFERDSTGGKPNGFTSADSSIAHFSDSSGENMNVADTSPETIGQGLRIFGDDDSRLIINFDVPIKKLSLVFGNDDPGFTQAGDVALLNVYRGGVLVDSTSVVMNRNDEADQTIGVAGGKFKRAELVYARGETPIDLIEIVDNIRFSPVCTIKGTNSRDRLDGNAKKNSICGFEGNDRINARGKNDFAHGGGGKDRVKGGPGDDTLLGGSGPDVIRAQDGIEGNDTVYGGGGNDTCYVDANDYYLSCEEVFVAV